MREINTKIILEWAHKEIVKTLHYSISYVTWSAQKWWSKKRFSHINLVLHLLCLRYDLMMMLPLIMQCSWWCHSWLNNCDLYMWKVKSNSLDIDFIQSDIHGRLCKTFWYLKDKWPQWGLVAHICISEWAIIGLGKGFLSVQHQAITWIKADIFSIG